MSFDRRQSSAAPAAQSQTSRDAAPDSGPLRAMSGLGQQDAHLSPANQGYAAGAAAYAPVQLRGVGGPGGDKADGKADEKKPAGGPKRVERGHFERTGNMVVFVGYGIPEGAYDQEVFLFVTGGREFEVRVHTPYRASRSRVYKDDLPDWLWGASPRPEETVDKEERPSQGKKPRVPVVRKTKISEVTVSRVSPDLSRLEPKELDGKAVQFSVRVVIDGQVRKARLEAAGDRKTYRFAAEVRGEVEDFLRDEELSGAQIDSVVRPVVTQLEASGKVPAAWLRGSR